MSSTTYVYQKICSVKRLKKLKGTIERFAASDNEFLLMSSVKGTRTYLK